MFQEIIEVFPGTAVQFAVAGGAAGGVFSVVKWFFEFIGKRSDLRADRLDADTRFVIENLRSEFSRVTTRLTAAEDHITNLREKLILCEEQHSQSKAEVAKLSAVLDGYTQTRKDDMK